MRYIHLAVGMALLAAPASGAHAQGPATVGVGAHELDSRSLQQLGQLGVRHVRHTVYWSIWEGDASYRAGATAAIRKAAASGHELLVVVHQQPEGFRFANRAQAFAAYADFMGMMARRFPEVRHWQLWNEMDVDSFTDLFGARNGLSQRQRGRVYGEMLRLAYPAIKRANPSAVVVTGGIASEPSEGFVHGLMDSRAPWDVLAIHGYGFPVAPTLLQKGRNARAALAGDPRPIWATEFGMEEAVIPPDRPRSRRAIDDWHLETWRESITQNDRQRVFARLYGHVLRENGDASYDLVRRDGSFRPAARWLQDYMR